MSEERVGKVTHYWPKAHAAQVALDEAVLRKGDKIRVRGHGHDFIQNVESIQVDHKDRFEARPGEAVAVAVKEDVHDGDEVWLVERTSGPKE